MPRKKRGDEAGPGLSRRDFFRSGTAGALTTGILGQGKALGESGATTEILGPGKVAIKLSVNGKLRRLEVEPRVTLLDALRNQLDLTGSKRVCDRGTCGACTIILDGKAVYACSILAIEAQGKLIETIEGLGSEESLHPLQQAFVENDAQQCGFCTPGFVVACKSLLDANPNPSLEEINEGLGGNLCRCGTYMGIRQAVLDTAAKGGSDG
jgi:xanthine dehydrogenase YagT iron-sulfur-binding subunit